MTNAQLEVVRPGSTRLEYQCSICGYEFSSDDPDPQCRQCLQGGRIVTASPKLPGRAKGKRHPKGSRRLDEGPRDYKCPRCKTTFSSEDADPQCLSCLRGGRVVSARLVKERPGLTLAAAIVLAALASVVIAQWLDRGLIDYRFEDLGASYHAVRLLIDMVLVAGAAIFFVVKIRRAKTKQARDTLYAVLTGFGVLALLSAV